MRLDDTRRVIGRRVREDFDEYDDDISIDFIDDSPKPTIKQTTDDKLNIIFNKLEKIENYLKQLIGDKQPSNENIIASMDRLPRGAQQILDEPFAMPQLPHPASNALLASAKDSPALYAPKNVRPQGSILEEIQQVLTTQDVEKLNANSNQVSTACSPTLIYDDDI